MISFGFRGHVLSFSASKASRSWGRRFTVLFDGWAWGVSFAMARPESEGFGFAESLPEDFVTEHSPDGSQVMEFTGLPEIEEPEVVFWGTRDNSPEFERMREAVMLMNDPMPDRRLVALWVTSVWLPHDAEGDQPVQALFDTRAWPPESRAQLAQSVHDLAVAYLEADDED